MKKIYISPKTDWTVLTGLRLMVLGNTSVHASPSSAPEKRASVF